MTPIEEQTHFRIGLTGGIASGKTTVADLFQELGADLIDTDIIARELVRPGMPALEEIRARFGDEVIASNGTLDRKRTRKLVFGDDDARLDLETILHPRIGAETRRQANAASGPYQIIVVPLLAGSPLAEFMNRILVVDCDEQTQINRLLERDTETEEQARRILAAQVNREQRLAIADDVIVNDDGLDQLRDQVRALDQRYRKLAIHSDPHET